MERDEFEFSGWGNTTDKFGSSTSSGEVFGGFPHPRYGSEGDPVGRGKRLIVDKRTHRIRYENETEHEVTVVIEPK